MLLTDGDEERIELTMGPADLALAGIMGSKAVVCGLVSERDSIGEVGFGMTEVMPRQNRDKEQSQIDRQGGPNNRIQSGSESRPLSIHGIYYTQSGSVKLPGCQRVF
jgi:hypothetical protein